MRATEYESLCEAMRRFNADEDRGWEDDMLILVRLKETHEREHPVEAGR